ncbi:MAG: glycosyltransferase, partial [Candidatus Sericytochromatia bacterium]
MAVSQAIELDAGQASAYHLLGLVLDGLGQPQWAEKAFRNVLQLDPDHPQAVSCRLSCREKTASSELDAQTQQTLERLLSRLYPTLSACLIVKDEAANLPRCLGAIKDWVDEIVVVDTGSTDDTVAIAESFGAKVFHFPWCDDFAAARNESLAHATSDWVLVVDADEELVVTDGEALRAALRCRIPAGYTSKLANIDGHGAIENDAPVMRLFQRDDRIRFAGRLHEQVGPSLEVLGWPVGWLDAFSFRHYGYQTRVVRERGKGERNIAIARAETEANSGDPLAWLNLGRSYTLDQRHEEAIAAFDRMAALPDWQTRISEPRWANYVVSRVEALRGLERHAEAEAFLTAALERMPGFPEFLFERGRARVAMRDVEGATADFEACMRTSPDARFMTIMRTGITDALPQQALAALARVQPQAQRPTLSACLIVKDEAANLPRCLESLKAWVDEIV